MKNTRNICIVWALIAAVFVMGCCIGLLVERHAKEQAALQADEICRSAAQEAHDAFQAYWNTGALAQYDRGTDCLAVFVKNLSTDNQGGNKLQHCAPCRAYSAQPPVLFRWQLDRERDGFCAGRPCPAGGGSWQHHRRRVSGAVQPGAGALA